jgi:uncharacterized membrane protein
MLLIAIWVSKPNLFASESTSETQSHIITAVSNQRIQTIMDTHCISCHSSKPTDDMFQIAPMGLVFDTWQDIERKAGFIYQRTSISKDMPFLNKSGMTELERGEIARWYLNQ